MTTLTSGRRFFGYGMVAVGLTFVPVATMTYVSDCYLPVNADALLLVNGLKVRFSNVFSADQRLTSLFRAEHCSIRIPTRRQWMGGDGLRQCIRHASRSLRRSISSGYSPGSVRREVPSQDCAVEDNFVSGNRKEAYIVLICRVLNGRVFNIVPFSCHLNLNP
jgi:hypothetical protein